MNDRKGKPGIWTSSEPREAILIMALIFRGMVNSFVMEYSPNLPEGGSFTGSPMWPGRHMLWKASCSRIRRQRNCMSL